MGIMSHNVCQQHLTDSGTNNLHNVSKHDQEIPTPPPPTHARHGHGLPLAGQCSYKTRSRFSVHTVPVGTTMAG
jgi:hypothetical protein